jgi:DnaK suppressor protein
MSDPKVLLEEKRSQLKGELARLETPPDQTAGISFGKRIGEGTSLAVDRLTEVATHEQTQAVLADVERSLMKIEEGSYGQCDNCEEVIAPARLEALPWAPLCVACAGAVRG